MKIGIEVDLKNMKSDIDVLLDLVRKSELELSIIPKLHYLEKHVVPFIESHKAWFSEQGKP